MIRLISGGDWYFGIPSCNTWCKRKGRIKLGVHPYMTSFSFWPLSFLLPFDTFASSFFYPSHHPCPWNMVALYMDGPLTPNNKLIHKFKVPIINNKDLYINEKKRCHYIWNYVDIMFTIFVYTILGPFLFTNAEISKPKNKSLLTRKEFVSSGATRIDTLSSLNPKL